MSQGTHFLFVWDKTVLRRHLGLWKPKHNAMEDPVLIMNAKVFVCLFVFNLFCFVLFFLFFQVTGKANIIVELMQKQIMVNMKYVGITLHTKYKASSKLGTIL